MTIAGYNIASPRVRIRVLGGPADLMPVRKEGVPPELQFSTILEDRLLRMEYVDEPKRNAEMLLQFDNYDGQIVNIGVVIAGLQMDVAFGYEGLMSKNLRVTVRRIKGVPVRSAGDSPVPTGMGIVEMECAIKKIELKLNTQTDMGTFLNMTVAEIAYAIATKYNFSRGNIFIQDTDIAGNKYPKIPYAAILDNESTEDFLVRLGAEYDLHLATTATTFKFFSEDNKKFIDTTEKIEYFYGPDVLDMSVDGDFVIPSTTELRGFDPNNRMSFAVLTNVEGSIQGLMQTDMPQRPKAQYKETVATVSAERAINSGMARMSARVRKRWAIRLTLVGNPKIWRRTRLNLYNFGPLIDGTWIVAGVRHVHDSSGYTTTLALRGFQPGTNTDSSGAIEYKVLRDVTGEIKGIMAIVNQVPTKKKKRKASTKKALAQPSSATGMQAGSRGGRKSGPSSMPAKVKAPR